MVVVESYTKLISDAINTHLPNSSYNNNNNYQTAEAVVTKCIHLSTNHDAKLISSSSSCVPSSFSSSSPPIITLASSSDDRSRLLVILRWIVHHMKYVYKLYLEKYMSHPITLALLPLLIGLGLGILIGCYYTNIYTYKKQWLQSQNNYDKDDNDGDDENVDDHEDNNLVDNDNNNNNHNDEEQRDTKTRAYLQSSIYTDRQSKIPIQHIPKHIAIIMDGNRRYGLTKYNSITRGHWDGSKTLLDFSKWCIAEHVSILTVYAFSTENWNRSQNEVGSLMKIFLKYCDELRVEAKARGICVRVLSTETDQIPKDVANGIHQMVEETKNNTKLIMNICLSYGSRGEITNACQSIARNVLKGQLDPTDITELTLSQHMLTHSCPDPDLVIRTSGEYRLSNFLLWQLAYAEMFFVGKNWPELTKKDLLQIIHSYAIDRKRRYGK